MFFYFLLACGKKKETLKLVAVTRGDIQEKALAVGTIEPERETKVKSTIPGIVSEVLFKVGDAVKAGAPLFKISPIPPRSNTSKPAGAWKLAEVTMKKLKADWERQIEMFKRSLDLQVRDGGRRERLPGSEPPLQDRHGAARAPGEGADQHVQRGDQLASSNPRPPASSCPRASSRGTPSCPLTNYQPGTELCSLADMDSLRFKGTVDEIDVGKITAGMDAEIQIGALPETKIAGRVARIYPKAKKEGNATLFDIEISIAPGRRDDPAGRLLGHGQHPHPRAPPGPRPSRAAGPLRERQALRRGPARAPEGRPIRKVEVQTGLSDGLNIEILSGVKEGDKVVERPAPRDQVTP